MLRNSETRRILPLFEQEPDISTESYNLSNIDKGQITVRYKTAGDKKAKDHKLSILPADKLQSIPADKLLQLLNKLPKLKRDHLTPTESKVLDACINRFLNACISRNQTEVVATANGLLAHLLTLNKKYSYSTKNKKRKKVLVLYMNDRKRWDNENPLDAEMYALSKIVAEKKRASGYDVTVANITQLSDMDELITELTAKKNKFDDVCLVGHSIRFNYDDYEPPYNDKPPLHDHSFLHLGGFALEDCANFLYQLATKCGVRTIKSFACESGLKALKSTHEDPDQHYEDHGEVPNDLDLFSPDPSIIQLVLAHMALLAQMDKYDKNMNLTAFAPNGIGLIDSANDFKFKTVDPRDYFQKEFIPRTDIPPKTKSTMFFTGENTEVDLQVRSQEAREKLRHKLEVLQNRLPETKDPEAQMLLKRGIKSLEGQLQTREALTKSSKSKDRK